MSEPVKLGARGKRVEPLQRGINTILGNREFKWRKVPLDGVAGQATFKSAHLALWLIGASEDQLRKVRHNKRITPRAFDLLTGGERSEAMKKRDKARHSEALELRRKHHLSNESQDGLSSWRGFTVAAWMVGDATGPDGSRTNWLQKSVDHGWSGGLYSGYRDPAYSESLCLNMCGAPSCPGTCAGRSSNHSGKNGSPPGWGAIDVQDYDTFGRVQREIGSPLHNDLPADHPHYSVTGR